MLVLCGVGFSLMSCAVGMALSGDREPNLGAIHIGQDRAIVLMNLGQPSGTFAEEGKRTDSFDLKFGNESSAGRALGHAAMDVMTFGAWEIIGTPIEGFSGSKQSLVIEYDDKDQVTKISSGGEKKQF